MLAITDRQSEILSFIRSFIKQHRLSPTVREISGHFKMNPRAAHDHLNALERKGYIDRFHGASERSARNIRLTELGA